MRSILFLGLVLRLIAIMIGPIAEDDWARYVWEGNSILSGGDPYSSPPETFFLDASLEEKAHRILSQVNHPDWPAIYSPLVEVFFAIAAWIDPYEIYPILILYLFCDLWIAKYIFEVGGLIPLGLFFLNPLWIKETYCNVHFEILMIFFVILGLSKIKHSFFFMGIATHIKIFAGLFLIILPPKNYKHLFYFGFGFLFPYWVAYIWFGDGKSFLNLFLFAKEFTFNSFFFHYISNEVWKEGIRLFFFIIVVFSIIHNKNSQHKTFVWTWGFTYLLSFMPVVNPWYFLLVLPFAALNRDLILLFVLSIPQVSYLTYTRLGDFSHGFYDLPNEIMGLELLGFLIGLGVRSYLISRKDSPK